MTRPRSGSPRAVVTVPAGPSTRSATGVDDPPLALSVSDGIAHVRLNRPDRLNALTLDTLTALAQTAHSLAAAKLLLNQSAAGSTGRTFARERRAQLRLLLLSNTRRAQRAARSRSRAGYGPRARWTPGAVLSRGKPRG